MTHSFEPDRPDPDELLAAMSNRVMNILSEFVPSMEIYSIDEAFLDFSGFSLHDLASIGEEMRSRVMKWTGIPISVGFAPTKALSKAANHIAKKFPERTGGVYLIDNEEKRLKALKWLKVEDVWGIGRRHDSQNRQSFGFQNEFYR